MNDAQSLELKMVGPPGWDPFWDELSPHVRYYDRRGNQITMRDYSRLTSYAGHSYKAVKQENVGPYWVSTVWLGLDHSLGFGPYPPLIFESMVFKGERSDLDCRRYATEEEALTGHEEIVNEVSLMVDATDGLADEP